jgi:hypothetical protein
MSTNIYNPSTGQRGYQVPGAAVPTGWQPIDLPQATPPTSTADVNSTSLVKLPSTSLSGGDPTTAAANISGISKGLSSGQDYLNSILPLLQTQFSQQSADTKALTDKMTSPGDAKTSALDQLKALGISPTDQLKELQSVTQEVTSLKGEYDKLQIQKNQELDNIRTGFNGTTGGLTDAMSVAERNANFKLQTLSAQINSKAAYANALQGNYQASLDFVDRAVNDVKENNNYYADLFNITENQNKEMFSALTGTYKDAWNIAKDDANQKRLEQNNRVDTLTALAKSIAGTASSSVYGSIVSMLANPNLSDADIAKAYSMAGVPLAAASKSSSEAGSFGFKNSKIESDVRADAVSLLDQVKAGTSTLDEAYSRLRLLYSPQEASDQAIKDLLGIKAPVDTSGGFNTINEGPKYVGNNTTTNNSTHSTLFNNPINSSLINSNFTTPGIPLIQSISNLLFSK